MEITVSRQDLVKELTATQSVVERKTTIPILSNFLLEAEDDRLNITATDLDQAIRTSTAVKVKKPGACTIPARKLYDYIKLLPDGDISIKLLENHWVQIRSGRSNTKIVGMARANYPQVPEFPTDRRHQHPARQRSRPSSPAPSSPSPTRSRATRSTAPCSSSRPSRWPWWPPTAIASRSSKSPTRTSKASAAKSAC